MPDPILKVTDLESSVAPNNDSVSVNMFTQDISLDETVVQQTIILKGGWNLIGIYIDAQKSYTDGVGTFANGDGLPELLYSHASNVVIGKDYLGSAYLPQFNFNGVGSMINGQGYQIKMAGHHTVTYEIQVTGRPIVSETILPFFGTLERYGMTEMYFPLGWSFFTIPFEVDSNGIPGPGSLDVHTVFSHLLSDQIEGTGSVMANFVTIIKDNLGSAYLPEFSFNGIGDLVQGQGYQIKTAQAFTVNLSGNVI